MGNILNLKIQGPTDPSVDNPELSDNDSSTNENGKSKRFGKFRFPFFSKHQPYVANTKQIVDIKSGKTLDKLLESNTVEVNNSDNISLIPDTTGAKELIISNEVPEELVQAIELPESCYAPISYIDMEMIIRRMTGTDFSDSDYRDKLNDLCQGFRWVCLLKKEAKYKFPLYKNGNVLTEAIITIKGSGSTHMPNSNVDVYSYTTITYENIFYKIIIDLDNQYQKVTATVVCKFDRFVYIPKGRGTAQSYGAYPIPKGWTLNSVMSLISSNNFIYKTVIDELFQSADDPYGNIIIDSLSDNIINIPLIDNSNVYHANAIIDSGVVYTSCVLSSYFKTTENPDLTT